MRNHTGSTQTLTPESFRKFLQCLDADENEASEKYLQIQRNLVRFFENRGLNFADELADEVINRIVKKIESGEVIENPSTYAVGIARFVVLEARRENAKEQTFLQQQPDSISPQENLDEKDFEAKRLNCLNKCLVEISSEDREIIIGYYQGEKSAKIELRAKIAEKCGISANALRKRAVRLREGLGKCINLCLNKNQTRFN
jgi:RNA polymerase sigma factor (sigma-70 family)